MRQYLFCELYLKEGERMPGFIKETVCFEIVGGSVERFLNIANRRWLNVFNVNNSDGRVFAFTSAKEFPALCAVAAKANAELVIISHFGLPYYIRHYSKRWGFTAGFLLFCVALWVMSLFVWSVDLENLPEQYAVSVTDLLYEEGIRTGVLCSSIHGDMLQTLLEEKLPQFDMIQVSRMGSKAKVKFNASVPIRKTIENHEPCDLIAGESGQIVSATASQGTIFVKQGDIVVPGDVLVSGVFDSLGESIVMVHAKGNVTALVDKTFSETVNFSQIVTEPTGHVININRLMAFGIEIPLFGSLPKGNYSRTYEEIPLSVLGFDFPIVLRREQWHELCYTEKQFTPEECTEQAEAILDRKIKKTDHIEVVSSERTVNETNSGIRVTRYVTFLKEISEERPLQVERKTEDEQSPQEPE